MSRKFSVIIERDEEGYYVASVPALLEFVGVQRVSIPAMSGKLPALTGAEVIQALERSGFAFISLEATG